MKIRVTKDRLMKKTAVQSGMVTLALLGCMVDMSPASATDRGSDTATARELTTAQAATRTAILGGTAAVGAVLGGPVGFIVGAATGAWLGDNVTKGLEHDELQQELAIADAQAASLDQELMVTNAEALSLQQQLLDAEQTAARYQNIAYQNLNFQVLFHTGANSLETDSDNRVVQLAEFLVEQPDLQIRLSGHADPRGNDALNMALSAQRVDYVRQLLEANGVHAERITGTSFGDLLSHAPENNYDAYALERRVTLELIDPVTEPGLARLE